MHLFRFIRLSMVVGAILFVLEADAHADFYSWDFLTGDFDNLALTPFGDGAVNLIRPGKKGLRLQLPLGEKTGGIGFASRFQLHGDFEVTVRYRIESIQTPVDGWGAGPSLYMTTVSDLQPASQLSRLSRKDDREIHSIFRALPVDGERTKLYRQFDTKNKQGKLRIARAGSQMTWSVAEGLSEDFDVLLEEEFDSADVGLVRVALQQSSPATGGAIYIEHLNIVADGLPHLPTSLVQTERIYNPRFTPDPVVPSRGWVGYLVCAIVVAGGAGTWFVKRRRV